MDLEKEIIEIRERNRRVEADKAWERSMMRRVSITALTYIFASLWLYSIGNSSPFLNSIIPSAGYFISTLTLSFIRSRWRH